MPQFRVICPKGSSLLGKNAEAIVVRIDRIELATSNDRVQLRLHPAITVVTGLGKLEREALASEVLGAVGPGRAGLSVDLVADNGRCLEVHRPLTGPSSVRDAVTCEDVTNAFLFGETVDILGALGLSRSQTRETLHFSEKDLQCTADLDATIARLGSIDQTRLWEAAIRLAEVEVEMAGLVDNEITADPLVDYADEIEHAHALRDIAADQLDQARSQSISGSGALTFIGIAVGLITHLLMSIPFLLGAAGLAIRAWRKNKAFNEAVVAEEAVLTRAGVASYLNFQMKKVDELTSNNDVRSRSLELAESHRHARGTWESVAGKGVDLEWAASQRPQITAAATRLQGDSGYPAGHATECLARTFVAARSAVGESVPIVIDEPFAAVTDLELLDVLAAMETYAPHMQFIVMTNDDRILRWTRARMDGGLASIVKLGLEETTEPTHHHQIAEPVSAPIARATVPAMQSVQAVQAAQTAGPEPYRAMVPTEAHQLN